jgi:hypothetical protein
MNKLTTQFAAGAFLAATSAGAHALAIDSFDDDTKYFFGFANTAPDGNAVVTDGTSPLPTSANKAQTGVADALGGDRTTTVTQTVGNSAGNTITARNFFESTAGSGVFDVAVSNSTNGNVSILWDNFTDEDLTAGGVTGFFVDIPTAIDNRLTITFNVMDGATTGTFGRTFNSGASGPDFFFPFASFDNDVFSSVDSVEFVLSSPDAAWDAQIDLVETRERPPQVPVPGTVALLGAGLVGFAARRRTRRA